MTGVTPPSPSVPTDPAPLAAASADGSTVVAARVLRDGLAAVVVRRPAWSKPEERGLDVRRWRFGGDGWFPTKAGLYLDADALLWLAAQIDAARKYLADGGSRRSAS